MNIQDFRNELDELYSNRFLSAYPCVSKPELLKNGIVVYGNSVLGKAIVNSLLQCDIPVSYIIDKNSNFHGSQYMGIQICPIEYLREVGEKFVMLGSTHIREMANECKNYGVEKWILPASVSDFCYIANEIGILNLQAAQVERLMSAFELLTDEKSRQIFRAFVRYHHIFDNDFSQFSEPVMYFPADLREINFSRFVDIGGFDGDTLTNWLDHKSDKEAYWFFEPNFQSYQSAVKMVDKLPDDIRERIIMYNLALGSYDGVINFGGSDGFSGQLNPRSMAMANIVACHKLDSLDLSPSFIKMDVEGAEMDILHGAEVTIKKWKPTLAISVYHRFSDIYDIPLYIKNLNPDYEIFMRHYPKVFTDTVCFAIPR